MVDPKVRGNLFDALLQARVRARILGLVRIAFNYAKSVAAGHRGGREPGETKERDIQMAREFQKRRSSSSRSDSALKADIGRKHELKRSAAIEAVNRGLKKLCG
jgi:hypothetical protein